MDEIKEGEIEQKPIIHSQTSSLATKAQTTISAAVSSVCGADIVSEPRGADIKLLKRMQLQMEEETLDDVKKGKIDATWLQENTTLFEFSHSILEKITKAFFDLQKTNDGIVVLKFLPGNNLFRIENLLNLAISSDTTSRQVICNYLLVPELQDQEMDVIQKELERIVSSVWGVRVNRILAHIAWVFDNTRETVYERYMRAIEECEDIEAKEWLAEYLALQGENEEALELLCSLFERDKKEYAHLLPVIVILAVSVKSPNILKYVPLLKKENPTHAVALCNYCFQCGKTIPEKMQAFQIHAQYMDKVLENPKKDLGYYPVENLEKLMKQFALERSGQLPEININPGNSDDVSFEEVTPTFSSDFLALRALALDFQPDMLSITTYWWRLKEYITVSLEIFDALYDSPKSPSENVGFIQHCDFITPIVTSINSVYPGVFSLPDQIASDYTDYAFDEILPYLLKHEAEITLRKYEDFVEWSRKENLTAYGALCVIIADTLRLVEEKDVIDEKNSDKRYVPSYAFDTKALRALTGGKTFVAPWNMNTEMQ